MEVLPMYWILPGQLESSLDILAMLKYVLTTKRPIQGTFIHHNVPTFFGISVVVVAVVTTTRSTLDHSKILTGCIDRYCTLYFEG